MEKLRIMPLGGLGEIGMNCLVLEYGTDMVLVDCGIQFPDATYAGVDLLVPDLSYVRERISHLRGVVVTHGHDDHIGGIPFLAHDTDLDIYCTPFPRGLIQQKFTEYQGLKEVRYHEIRPRQTFTLGPFTFDPISVQHSIIESVAFAIHTPVGMLIHTGDFKHDPNETKGQHIGFGPFEELGKKGVLLLLSDSTNAERMGHTLTEADIAGSFEQIFTRQTGRLFIALFASNIRRVENLLAVAARQGKKVALAGRSMHSYTKLAFEQSSMSIPENTLVLLENIHEHADDRVVVLLTGSQAEPQSALVRISQGIHKDIEIKAGDTIILSSRFIPGNERNITSMIDHLYRQGAEVIYESFHQIHVSGHGFQEELMMMLRAASPRFFVPIHGEYRHLAKHAKLAREAGVAPGNTAIIENGQAIELDADSLRFRSRRELRKGIVVGGYFMEGDPSLFSQRNNLAKTGIVFALFLRDTRTRELVAPPALSAYGLLLRAGEDLEATLREASEHLEDAYEEAWKREDLTEVLRLEVRRFFRHRASHKPVVIPIVSDV